MLSRLVLALVAVLVLAGLGVMERNARLLARAQAALEQPLDAQATARVTSDLDAAARLNPDTTPELELADLEAFQGRTGPALGIVQDVVRREPENLAAWSKVYGLARVEDPAVERQAAARIRQLLGRD